MGDRRVKPWYWGIPRVLKHFAAEEILEQRTLLPTLRASLGASDLRFARSMTLADLLARQAERRGGKPFLFFEEQSFSFAAADRAVNQVARFLKKNGAAKGDGLGLFFGNRPEFLFTYFATQRLGLCAVPINTELKGDGLGYIVSHSEIQFLVTDEKHLQAILAERSFGSLRCLILVDRTRELADIQRELPKSVKVLDFEAAYRESGASDPRWGSPRPADRSTILYTSGTTGRPKGVVFDYQNTWVRKLGLFAHLIFEPGDRLYTCLPLFHANALFLTMAASLWLGIPVVLARKFSARRFWSDLAEHGVTVTSAIGAMIPILLKAPPSSADRGHRLRLLLSAACPANAWREFEERFGVTIWEGYSAVDGGQNFIYNLGNAPVGSFGKPKLGTECRVVLEDGTEAPPRVPGELLFKVRDSGKKKAVDYFKDEAASAAKVQGGYIHSGDLVYRDEEGFLYFVGRKTESMRRRGENVSAYEVENVLAKHPGVLECAVYGVPSDLAEEEIMCAVVPVEGGGKLDPGELAAWLRERLASYAVPRYVRFVEELPKTGTHRVVKAALKEAGVTPDAIDLKAATARPEAATP